MALISKRSSRRHNRETNFFIILLFLLAMGVYFFESSPHVRKKIRSLTVGEDKVAFLFITKGPLPLDFLWDRFFQQADPSKPFSIYIHPRPGFKFNETTTSSKFFYNKQIEDSIMVEWGEISMIEAERRLLKSALMDARNQRFILLSDSCIFLYNYNYVYDYVMMSQKSFIDSFHDSESNTNHRYNSKMAPAIQRYQWRKGSQWFVLLRKHAQAVISDYEIYFTFLRYCRRVVLPDVDWTKLSPKNLREPNITYTRPPDCIPDEHFIQTLLAVKGMEPEIESRTLTFSQWKEFDKEKDKKGWHPSSFSFSDTTPELLLSIKGISHIWYPTEQRMHQCKSNGQVKPCYLFARKFLQSAGSRIIKRLGKFVGLSKVGYIRNIE